MTPTKVWLWDFLEPGRLWALLALPLLLMLYIIVLRLRRTRGVRYTNTAVVDAVLPRQSQWRRHVAVVMTLASLAMIAGAWARPVGIDKVPRERATIVVVLDASLSMQAKDVSPSRFEAEKEAAKTFVDNLPAQYNVSVVMLTGAPGVMVPPTQDRGVVKLAIDRMELGEGTAIGDAIQVALQAIAQAPGSEDGAEPAPGLIVLLSDGQTTSGQDPAVTSARAAEQGVQIHTIAFGTENGYVDIDGKRENVAPDRGTLQQIAQATGGRALDAKDAGQLENVYEEIGSEVGTEEVHKEVTARWALYALAFAIVASLGAVSMAARWP